MAQRLEIWLISRIGTFFAASLKVGYFLAKIRGRENSMDEAAFEKKLDDLVNEIGSTSSPQNKKLKLLAEKTRDYNKKTKKNIHRLQESFDYLRLGVKYLLFDLEATRRENTYLRKLLEDKSR